jgi:hypothetical protein
VRILLLALLCCLVPLNALAQVYVGGAVGADTMLVSGLRGEFAVPEDDGGTVASVAGRVGVALGGRWGVEFEAAQGLTLEETSDVTGSLAARSGFVWGSAQPLVQGRVVPVVTVESERRSTAYNALGWFRYPVSARLDLAFVAGAAFTRTWTEQRIDFELGLPGFPAGVVTSLFPAEPTEIVSYEVGPIVGAEAWLAFGDRLRLVPGVRLSAAGGGWSVRPSVGAAWTF